MLLLVLLGPSSNRELLETLGRGQSAGCSTWRLKRNEKCGVLLTKVRFSENMLGYHQRSFP